MRMQAANSGTIVIRAAAADNQEPIVRFVRETGLNPLGLAWPNFVVAEEMAGPEPQIIGIGQLKPYSDGSVELASLAVDPAYQGRGLGKLLVQVLMARAPGPLYLMCRRSMAGYYRRFGFVAMDNPDALPRKMARLVRIGRPIAGLVSRLRRDPAGGLAFMAYPQTFESAQLDRPHTKLEQIP